MRGRGARRKAGTQKRPRSVSPDGNRLNEGDKDLRILLIGLPGHGKSATVNSLLGQNISSQNSSTRLALLLGPIYVAALQSKQDFVTQHFAKFAKAQNQIQSGVYDGRKITIVSFVLNNPSRQNDKGLREQLLQAEKMLHPGLHAVCFVLDPHRITDLNDQFQPVMEYFGDDANDYAFVIMTFTKDENEREKCFPYKLEANHQAFKSVSKFCNSKELYIDNSASPAEKEKMIKEMSTSIDCANIKKQTPHFSTRYKQQMEAAEAAQLAEAARAAQALDASRKAAEALAREREAFEAYKTHIEEEKKKSCTIL